MSDLSEHFRLFIAIAVPEEIKAQIQTARDQLRAGLSPAAVRWTRADQFHLTLRFLGSIQADLVQPLVNELGRLGQSLHPLKLQARGLGFFPNNRAPRVIWAGVQDLEQRLATTQKAVQEMSARFSSEQPERHFNGHITLGRVKHLRREELHDLAGAAKQFADSSFGEWTARQVHLMRSELSAEGAQHRVVAEIPFA